MNYSEEEKQKFQNLLFTGHEVEPQISTLNQDQKNMLAEIIAQKIVCQATYKPSYPPLEKKIDPHEYHPPNLLETLCCCFYPESHNHAFSLTTALFFQKICRVIQVWKNDFLEIKEEENSQPTPDLYGPLWLTITYILILGVSENFNNYFVNPQASDFSIQPLSLALIVTVLFQLISVLFYASLVRCIGGNIQTIESADLIGYSLILNFLPTALCMVPSQLWHIIMLGICTLFRVIFLCRNYTSRIQEKLFVLIFFIILLEAAYFVLIMSQFFGEVISNDISTGIHQIFHLRGYSDLVL